MTIQSFRCFAKCIFGVLFVVSGLLLSGDESLANFWIVFSVLSHSPESILLELFFAKARGLPSLFQCYNSVLCLHLRKICSSAVCTSQCTVTNSQITILFIMCNGIAIQTSGQRFSIKISSFTSQVSLPFDRVRTFKMRIWLITIKKNNTPRVSLGLWDLSGGVRFRCESTTPFVLCKRFV